MKMRAMLLTTALVLQCGAVHAQESSVEQDFMISTTSFHKPSELKEMLESHPELRSKLKDGRPLLNMALMSVLSSSHEPENREDRISKLKILWHAGADVSFRHPTGLTVLDGAILSEETDEIVALLQMGADPNGTSGNNETPLQMLMTYILINAEDATNVRAITTLLVDKGANVNAEDPDIKGESILSIALKRQVGADANNPALKAYVDVLKARGAH